MNKYFLDNEKIETIKNLIKSTLTENEREKIKHLKTKYPSINLLWENFINEFFNIVSYHLQTENEETNFFKLEYNQTENPKDKYTILLKYVYSNYSEDYKDLLYFKSKDLPKHLKHIKDYLSVIQRDFFNTKLEITPYYDNFTLSKVICLTDKELDSFFDVVSIDKVDKNILKKTEKIKKCLDTLNDLMDTDIDREYLLSWGISNYINGYQNTMGDIYKNDFTILHNSIVR